jgi:hypothetical protein
MFEGFDGHTPPEGWEPIEIPSNPNDEAAWARFIVELDAKLGEMVPGFLKTAGEHVDAGAGAYGVQRYGIAASLLKKAAMAYAVLGETLEEVQSVFDRREAESFISPHPSSSSSSPSSPS